MAVPIAEQTWPADPATVPAARRLVREHLRTLGEPGLAGDAELLVTELVSNVVLHVGGSVRVSAWLDDDGLLLEVSDDSPVTPLLRAFSETSSTGRGMRLVHSLSAEHGVRLGERGKTVWVRVSSATAQRDDGELAAAFADVDWLGELPSGDADGPVVRGLAA